MKPTVFREMSHYSLLADVFIKFRIFFIPEQQHREVSLVTVMCVDIHECVLLFSFTKITIGSKTAKSNVKK